MAHVQFTLISCTSCNRAVDMHVFNLTSLLGPALLECHHCGNVLQSDRIEWADMSWKAKTWFYVISLLYGALAFFLGGMSIHTAVTFLETNAWPGSGWHFEEPSYWIGGIVWVIIVMVIQAYRINCSLARRQEPELKPHRTTILSFHTAGQIKLMVLMMVVPAVCWVFCYIRQML